MRITACQFLGANHYAYYFYLSPIRPHEALFNVIPCSKPLFQGMNLECLLQNGDHFFTWWRHQMETFSALLALCAGNSPVPVNSPHKGQWRGALVFSLIFVWINGWVNNREAGDLRRHRGHYDVNVTSNMFLTWSRLCPLTNIFDGVQIIIGPNSGLCPAQRDGHSFGVKPLCVSILSYCQSDPTKHFIWCRLMLAMHCVVFTVAVTSY